MGKINYFSLQNIKTSAKLQDLLKRDVPEKVGLDVFLFLFCFIDGCKRGNNPAFLGVELIC